MYRLLLFSCLALGVTSSPALAAPGAPDSQQAIRLALTQYDLEGGKTLKLLARMPERLRKASERERDELRFLRAAVAADLAFIAALRQDAELSDGLRRGLGLGKEPALTAWLDAELSTAAGAYRIPAQTLRRALAYLADGEGSLEALAGTQGEVLRLLAMRKALANDAPAVESLGALSHDPCARDAACPARLAALEPAARRAAAALERAAASLQHLKRAAGAGDPLAAALTPEVGALEAELRAVSLRAVPELPAHLGLARADDVTALTPDVVFVVSNEGVHYGFAPQLRLDAEGKVAPFATRAPMLPAMERLQLPDSFRPYLTPLKSVQQLVSELERDDGAPLVVAAGAARGTRAHLLARALLALHACGHQEAFILARSSGGHARGVPVDLVSKRSAPDTPSAHVRLRIRLGGYSLHRGDDFADIPRVRDENGLRFDVETLMTHLDKRIDRAELSFMADVATETLMTTAVQLARRTDEVQLVFP